MKIIEKTVYSFNELSEKAKQKAIDSIRYSGHYLDYNWYSLIFEEFEDKHKDIFDIDKIYFRGFYSQGDGAMFEYSGIKDKLRVDFINSLKISTLRKKLLLNNTMCSGEGVQSGLYCHQNSCKHSIYWEIDNGDIHWSSNVGEFILSFYSEFESYVIDIYKDLCEELYKSLEAEYEYLMSDEYVIEHETDLIEFEEDGSVF